MLDGDDPGTRAAVRELHDIATRSPRPLVVWIGAGTSAWAGLATWRQLADASVKEFTRLEPATDSDLVQRLGSAQDFPALFEHLREVNPQRFNAFITNALSAPEASPIFQRFSGLL